ncbi:organic cation transporter protein-like [Biomphalaria glabrata]|uniref:Organic cation transporter protein-like n=1 Tax=Biomphalaria glabrata TaxID=6526 RepID=A0A9W3APR4_BIOGL|nr:organic cation transporter protein-like [Biomphalaria glabrata]XP_055889223.1 organic cation transporter protein-like [Biomphalaria glabrata]XP_055889225.1 organic cation transporter protein-like [Biomphalaria glabrata]XP_055889226.1 organic cation transporter protein-like [Biomphalaria glabrata]
MHFDELMKMLGEFGRYQKIRFFMVCMFSVVSAWHALNMVFIGAAPAFHCKTSELNLTGTPLENLTAEDKLKMFLPEGSSCYQYDVEVVLSGYRSGYKGNLSEHSMANNSKGVVSCQDGYEFSKADYAETITSEFSLVCGEKFWIRTSKSIFFAGRLSGAVIFGQLSDRFGRRPMFFIGCLLLLIAGTVASFAPNMYVFLPMYFCQGAAHTGAFLVTYTLSTELVGPMYRVFVGFVIQGFYSIGFMTLAGMAYLIREWRYLEMAITFPVVLFSLYWWFLPESIRWLLSHGKDIEAEKVITRAAKENGVEIDKNIFKSLKEDSAVASTRNYYFIDCVNTWKMAKLSFNIWFNRLINSLVYYGLSLNTENLAGSPYLNFFIAGAVEIPAYALCILLLNRVGRRWPLILSMYVGGIACILSECIPSNRDPATVNIILAMVGKFCITASYAIIYLMAAELFPTVVRSIGMGVASMSTSIGGILATIFLDLQVISKSLPLIVFGSLSVVAGSLAFLLPEPAGKPLPQTPDDVDGGKACINIVTCRKRRSLKMDTELQDKPAF